MAVTVTGTPVTDALVAVFEDAIACREPDTSGCCEDSPVREPMCGDHQADKDRADAMAEVLAVIRTADSDEATLVILAAAPYGLLTGICGGDRDDG